MIYFTADTHFFHSNIIHLNNRPFKDLDDMHRMLIRKWNALVTPKDEIYILGDFIFKGSGTDANELLEKLNGRKYLIRGNHDKFLEDSAFNRQAFAWVQDYYVLTYNKRKFVLFHYPILEWEGYYGNTIHLYGHVHNSGKDPDQEARFEILGNRAVNVGVDVHHFYPVSIESILAHTDES